MMEDHNLDLPIGPSQNEKFLDTQSAIAGTSTLPASDEKLQTKISVEVDLPEMKPKQGNLSPLDYLPSFSEPPIFEEMPELEPHGETAHYTSPVDPNLFSPGLNLTSDNDVKDLKAVPGICGLRNLGNTCFMNAGLQCLFNNRQLLEFFLEKFDGDETLKGTLTGKFAHLIAKVWSGNYTVLHPSTFKQLLGDYHPQFRDFRQHDCQEFLVLLLDTLHQQLNTASSKSIQSDISVECSQSMGSVDDRTVEVDPDEQRSDTENQEDTEEQETNEDSHVMVQPLEVPTTQPHLSESSSHSASPRSTDSFSSWDAANIRLQPIPENVKSFSDVSISSSLNSSQSEKKLKVIQETSEYGDFNQTSLENSSNNITDNSANIIPTENLITTLKKSETVDNIHEEKKEKLMEKNILASQLNYSRRLPNFEDFIKETKTLNTNVLVTEEINNQYKFDSEKYPKLEHIRPRETLDNLSFINFDPKVNNLKRVKETNVLLEHKELNTWQNSTGECSSIVKRQKMEENLGSLKTKENKNPSELMETENHNGEESETSSQSGDVPLPICQQEGPSLVNDDMLASNEWEKYLDKNQSVVVDVFQGQFRSTVICSECGHVSVTYEPFMYLPVPLPYALERQIAITYMPVGISPPVRYLVTVHKNARVQQLREVLLSMIQQDGQALDDVILAEVFDNHISRILEDNMLVQYINDTNRIVYGFQYTSPPKITSPTEVCNLELMPLSHGTSDDACYTVVNAQRSEDLEPDKGGGDDKSDEYDSRAARKAKCNEVNSGKCNENKVKKKSNENSQKLKQWSSCTICLEEMADSDLMTHPSCQCILCHNCIEISCRHYGGDSLICPVCSVPVKPEEEFVPNSIASDYKYKVRSVLVPVVFRMDTIETDGMERKKLFTHPTVLSLPALVPANTLYKHIQRNVPFFSDSSSSLLFVDGQGKNCSRCLFAQQCPGCEVAKTGDITFHPGDSLAVQIKEPLPLSVDIKSVADHQSFRLWRKEESLTLYDCLKAFSECETLDDDNPWFCPMCQQHQQARKSLSVWRSPNTLMVYLKRFVFSEFASIKVDDRVRFPLEGLDLTDFISGPCSASDIYNLQACVCHFGGVSSGHYTAYTRHAISGQWHHFNDEVTKKQAPREEDQTTAYILFYQKLGTKMDEQFLVPNTETGSYTNTFMEDSVLGSLWLKPEIFNRILKQLEDPQSPESKATSEICHSEEWSQVYF